jgi:NAD(P)-dependent dehydrogenase (short-subunit alcohol dehydrogenase family)
MGWTIADMPSQQGRTAVVTGTGGLGYETALALAKAGGAVILAGRNSKKGAEAVAQISAEAPQSDITFEALDLASLASVQAFADRLQRSRSRLDLLVNNAGVMHPPTRNTTKDGFELQFGSNFLGPFALTVRLLPLLLAAPAPRVATMASGAANFGRINFADLQWEQRYRPMPAYAQSKLANLMMSNHLARLAADHDWNLLSVAAHPGFTRTNLQTTGPGLGRERPSLVNQILYRFNPLPKQDVDQGTEPLLYAAADPAAQAGAYYGPSGWFGLVGPAKAAEQPAKALVVADQARLWSVAEQLTGVSVAAILRG